MEVIRSTLTRQYRFKNPAEFLTLLGLGTDLDVQEITLQKNPFDRELDLVVTYMVIGERRATATELLDNIGKGS